MMNVLLIQTGGTIDKDYPKSNDGYAFEIGEPAVVRIFEKIHLDLKYEVISLLQKDSLDMTDGDRQELKEFVSSSKFSEIIITHGSDTMVETANFIGDIDEKTIVFTGAYKPERFKASDADFNIGVAVGAINILKEGTFIAMNGKIMRSNNCFKNPDTGVFELK